MSKKEDAQNTLFDKIKSFLDDVTTLDVLMLSGTVTLKPADGGGGAGKFKWDELLKNVAEQLKVADGTELTVAAYTHAEWDHDSVNFFAKDLPDAARDLHLKNVETAHKSRMEALSFIGDLIK